MKTRVKKLIALGVFCVLFLLGAVWYANTYNGGRMVAPMDYSGYAFQVKDLPMIVGIALVVAYGLGMMVYLLIYLSLNIMRSRSNRTAFTRTLAPKLGYLGFLGFLGFAGCATFFLEQTLFPFGFFIFFGFFGFYYEGKMSHTLMDERFEENVKKAELMAFKIGFFLLFVCLWLVSMGMFARQLELCALFLFCAISIIIAITLFLSKYLLYRLDQSEDF